MILNMNIIMKKIIVVKNYNINYHRGGCYLLSILYYFTFKCRRFVFFFRLFDMNMNVCGGKIVERSRVFVHAYVCLYFDTYLLVTQIYIFSMK